MSVPTCPYARVECVLPSSLSDSPATCKSSYTKLAVSSLKNTRNVTYGNECSFSFLIPFFFFFFFDELRLMPVCAYVGFPLKNRQRKEAGKYFGKQQRSSILDNLSWHFSLCYIDGGVKVLNCCWVCGRKWFSKSKRLYKRLPSLVLWLCWRST